MIRRHCAAAVLVLLVVAAGCTGGGVPTGTDGAEDGPTATDTGASGADPGDDADAGDAGNTELVEDREAALEAAGSFTGEFRMRVTEDGEVASESVYGASVDYERERSSFRMRMGSGDEVLAHTETYHADGVTYQYAGGDGYESYQADERSFDPRVGQSLQTNVYSASHLDDFTADGTETFDGVRVTRYVRTEHPSWLSAQQVDEEFRWTEFRYEVLVDDDGLVRSEEWWGEGVDEDDVTIRVEYASTVTDVGSTVIDEPDWLDEAGTPSP